MRPRRSPGGLARRRGAGYGAAFKLLHWLAEKGDALGQNGLGVLYSGGKGCRRIMPSRLSRPFPTQAILTQKVVSFVGRVRLGSVSRHRNGEEINKQNIVGRSEMVGWSDKMKISLRRDYFEHSSSPVLLVALLTIGLFGCSTSQLRSPKIKIMTPDMTLMMAEIRGLRVGMSPRMVQKQLGGLGFSESRFSRITLADAIHKSDVNPQENTQVILTAGGNTISNLDDESLTLRFCYAGLESINFTQTILLSDYEKYKRADIKMFPEAVPKISDNKQVLFSASYKPDRISSAYISYVNRGFTKFLSNEPVIERYISVLEQARCHNKEMIQILNRY